MLPDEIGFEISAWPHSFTGSILQDRPHVYLEMPKSFMIYRFGYSPTGLKLEDGKSHMREKEHVVAAFVEFPTMWYQTY